MRYAVSASAVAAAVLFGAALSHSSTAAANPSAVAAQSVAAPQALALASVATVTPPPPPARPGAVEVVVDVSEQRMQVLVDGAPHASWEVSTGKRVRWTPTGAFRVAFLSPRHRSSIYNNAPMPHSIFFNGNIAIHGTTETDKLGQRASRGCVRLHPDNAEELFGLVKSAGKQRTVIRVVD